MGFEIVFVLVAAFGAGVIDAMAGGGGLVQLPALFAAFPTTPHPTLLGTGKRAGFAGTTSAIFRFIRHVRIDWKLVLPASHSFAITATQDNALPTVVTSNVELRPGHYNSEYIRLSAERQQLLDPALVAAEREKLNATWSVFNQQRYWNGLFRVPVDQFTRISSPFGTRRSYDGGPMSSYHEGTDFATPAGTPVYAPADGVVMIAEPLAVRGNAIVIDHGWGLYSGYWHLSEFKVTPGQAVKQGDLIALSGNTGLSTGAHLHWDMRVLSLNVDAMQFTRQVFP